MPKISSIVLPSVVFLGSALLFQLELITARQLLPRFGGSFTVWSTCLVFFQVVMSMGYVFINVISQRMSIKKYAFIHCGLIILTYFLASLSFELAPRSVHPVIEIIIQLTINIGLIFILLSMTNSLGAWCHKSLRDSLCSGPSVKVKSSLFLFSYSNGGALIGLLTYPLLIEPFWGLPTQKFIWNVFYFLYTILLLVVLRKISSNGGTRDTVDTVDTVDTGDTKNKNFVKESSIPVATKIMWLLFSGCPSAFLLSTTNIISLEVTSAPLLWIIPLVLYLLTYILNFMKVPWYPKNIHLFGLLVIVIIMALGLLTNVQISVLGNLVIYYIILFLCCMMGHRHLYLQRPKDESSLTSYYAYITIGGLCGSLFIYFMIPLVARNWGSYYLEYELTLLLFILTFWIRDRGENIGRKRFFNLLTPMVLLMTVLVILQKSPTDLHILRNFYGLYRVQERNGLRSLIHGSTMHGQESLDPKDEGTPLSYYHQYSGVQDVFLLKNSEGIERVAVIGVGTGSMISYGRSQQEWDLYDIDPDVFTIARTYFTFLSKSLASYKEIVADGRIALQGVPDSFYDLIFVDAFSGDSIPAHLITKEAVNLYLSKLNPRGAIMFNISNRYLDLKMVLGSLAQAMNIPFSYVNRNITLEEKAKGYANSLWFIISRDGEFIGKLIQNRNWIKTSERRYPSDFYWTDSYTNILPTILLENPPR